MIGSTDFHAVTPDATNKTHFVLVDCVGVTEQALVDSRPLERQPTVPFDKLLQAVAFGSTDPDLLSSLAGRLARLDRQLDAPGRAALTETAGGTTLGAIVTSLIAALDPDRQVDAVRTAAGLPPEAEPTPEQVEEAARQQLHEAAAPLATNSALRDRLVDLKRRVEQTIDDVSKDAILEAAFSEAAREKAGSLVQSFEQFIRDNRDEITALQVLYSRPYARRLRLADIRHWPRRSRPRRARGRPRRSGGRMRRSTSRRSTARAGAS